MHNVAIYRLIYLIPANSLYSMRYCLPKSSVCCKSTLFHEGFSHFSQLFEKVNSVDLHDCSSNILISSIRLYLNIKFSARYRYFDLSCVYNISRVSCMLNFIKIKQVTQLLFVF